VPIRTWTPRDEQRVGFLEIDLVAHCGINNAGQYLYTLVATDVASGWTECMGVPSKRQDDVFMSAQVDDLAVVPLGAVPFMLGGYRESGRVGEDPNLEARIVWRHLQLGLVTLPRGPVPGRSWAERPLSMLVDTLAFFACEPPHTWRDFAPTR
jgi:hypothetical protein